MNILLGATHEPLHIYSSCTICSTPNTTTRTLQAPQTSRQRSAQIPSLPGTSATYTPCRSSFGPLA
jgi:hypothetical protein